MMQQTTGTIRQRIYQLLTEEELTVRDLSQRIGIREKDVFTHLPHVARTAVTLGKRLSIHAFRCLSCGFVFKERRRFTRPGRCPGCRRSHIEPPSYRIG